VVAAPLVDRETSHGCRTRDLVGGTMGCLLLLSGIGADYAFTCVRSGREPGLAFSLSPALASERHRLLDGGTGTARFQFGKADFRAFWTARGIYDGSLARKSMLI
jgi:hypothetical protein